MAAGLKSPWIAVHIEGPSDAKLSESALEQLAQTLRLVEQLGGETVTLSGQNVAEELIQYARSRNVTKIVVGKPKQSRWKDLWHGSLVYELTRQCGDIDVYVISGDAQLAAAPLRSARLFPRFSLDYLWAFLVVLACTGIRRIPFATLSPDEFGDDLSFGCGRRFAVAGPRAFGFHRRSQRRRI